MACYPECQLCCRVLRIIFKGSTIHQRDKPLKGATWTHFFYKTLNTIWLTESCQIQKELDSCKANQSEQRLRRTGSYDQIWKTDGVPSVVSQIEHHKQMYFISNNCSSFWALETASRISWVNWKSSKYCSCNCCDKFTIRRREWSSMGSSSPFVPPPGKKNLFCSRHSFHDFPNFLLHGAKATFLFTCTIIAFPGVWNNC